MTAYCDEHNRQAAADVPFDKEKTAVIKLKEHRVKDLNDKLKALEVARNCHL
jgi:hypothetical protein